MSEPKDPGEEPTDYSTPKPQPEQPPPYGPPGYGAPPPPTYAAPGYGPPPGAAPPPQYPGPPQYLPPPPQGYAAPPWAYQMPRRTNGFAIAALICGCAGFLTGCTAPLGIIFGLIARSQIKTTHEDGNGMALAGIILGALVTVGIGLLFLSVFAISHSSGPTY